MRSYSSLNDKPINKEAVGPMGRELFKSEQDNLLSYLKNIAKKACYRRVSFLFTVDFFFFFWKNGQ